jgi:hypothetical protein
VVAGDRLAVTRIMRSNEAISVILNRCLNIGGSFSVVKTIFRTPERK